MTNETEPTESHSRKPRQPGSPAGPPLNHISDATGPEVHLLDRAATVYRRRALAGRVFVVVVTLVMLRSYSTVPLYRAHARLEIDDPQMIDRGVSTDRSRYRDPEPYYQTQYRIIQSPDLARRVVRTLDLRSAPEFSSGGSTKSSPGAPPFAVAAIARALRSGVAALVRPAQEAPHPPTRTMPDADPDESALIGEFLSRIRVTPLANTQLVDVSFTAADPDLAARAVNAHIEGYVAENLERLSTEAQGTLIWLGGELENQRTLVEQAEGALADYRDSQGALSLGADDMVSGRLIQLNAAVTHLETIRLQKESLYNQVRNIDPNSDEAATFAAVVQNQAVQEATMRVSDLRRELTELEARYGLRHPKIVKAQSHIAAARRQLQLATAQAIQTVHNEYQSALDEERRLKAELQQQEQAALNLDRKSVGYSVLERDAESTRRIYDLLLQRQKELQVANNRTNNVRIVDRAQVPGIPFTPNTRRDWCRALLAGLVLALGLVFAVDYLDESIRTPDDVARWLHTPFLGLVPNVDGQRMPLLSETAPHEFGEAWRALRTSLAFASANSGPRIVALTSAQPLEGKTTSASNLAIVLALGGMRVLLIDGDMRRSSVHKAFGLPNAAGLSQVLAGQARVREVIQRSHDPNLFVLSAGKPPPNPSELLASDAMRSLLKNLETGPFDWVIIDTPPVLSVTDSTVVASMVGGVVFLVRAGKTPSRQAMQALDILQTSANPRIIGAVLSRVNLQRDKYYYSRYYGRYLRSYYGGFGEVA